MKFLKKLGASAHAGKQHLPAFKAASSVDDMFTLVDFAIMTSPVVAPVTMGNCYNTCDAHWWPVQLQTK